MSWIDALSSGLRCDSLVLVSLFAADRAEHAEAGVKHRLRQGWFVPTIDAVGFA